MIPTVVAQAYAMGEAAYRYRINRSSFALSLNVSITFLWFGSEDVARRLERLPEATARSGNAKEVRETTLT